MRKLFRTSFFYTFVVLSFLIGSSIANIMALAKKNKPSVFQNAARIWSLSLLKAGRIKIEVIGKANLPKNNPYIIISNHQGNADIPILLGAMPHNFRFIIKRELFKVPIFGWYLKKAGYLSINRESPREAKKTLEDSINILNQGENILIFPEGTRSYDGKLGKFKNGGVAIAQESGFPVVPVAIDGSYRIQKRGKVGMNSGKVRVIIGKPYIVEKSQGVIEATKTVRDKIQSLLET